MNIYILDYCNVYSADIYIYIHIRICTHLDFRPIWQYLPKRPFLTLAVKCQGQLHWRPPDNNQRRSTHPQSSPELQHGTRRCPWNVTQPKGFHDFQGFFWWQPQKLWNSSTKYDNGTETISSVDSLMSQNDNKTSYHSLKFGGSSSLSKISSNVIANLVTSL